MIFVTLGTQKFQLNRLLEQMDSICSKGQVDDEIFAQTGYSDYQPKHYKHQAFLSRDMYRDVMERSSLVITHGGVGSIVAALQADKPVIVFPRLKKYREHVDNHQEEIAVAFEKKNYLLCCRNEKELPELIDRAKTHMFHKYESSVGEIIQLVEGFLEE